MINSRFPFTAKFLTRLLCYSSSRGLICKCAIFIYERRAEVFQWARKFTDLCGCDKNESTVTFLYALAKDARTMLQLWIDGMPNSGGTEIGSPALGTGKRIKRASIEKDVDIYIVYPAGRELQSA